jgi:hypothetical protein
MVINGVDRLGDIESRSITVDGLGSNGSFFFWLLRKRGSGKILGVDPIASRCILQRTWRQIIPNKSAVSRLSISPSKTQISGTSRKSALSWLVTRWTCSMIVLSRSKYGAPFLLLVFQINLTILDDPQIVYLSEVEIATNS